MDPSRSRKNIFEIAQDFGAGRLSEEDSGDEEGQVLESEDSEDEETPIFTELQPVVLPGVLPDVSLPPPDDSSSESDTDTDTDVEEDTQEAENPDVTIQHHLIAKDGTMWSNLPPPQTSKTSARNIFKQPPSQLLGCQTVSDPSSAFRLFVTSDMVLDIVKYTNMEGERVLGSKWKNCDETEIDGLLGCILFIGTMKQNYMSTEMIWDRLYGQGIVRATMSRNRFVTLLTYLRFDDKITRTARRARDLFAPFRDLWEKFIKNLRLHYIPGPFVTVDEQLVPFRGRCPFLQYMPSKPDKYGIKLFWLADATNFYPYNATPYLGKVGRTRQIGLARNVVIDLMTPLFGSGRNVTTDNFFTDKELADSLLSHSVTIVGTVRSNKRFLPLPFKQKNSLHKYQSQFVFQKRMTLVNYQGKKEKNTIVLSTMHDSGAITDTSTKKKPDMVLFYNSTKGAVDSVDKLAHALTTKRKTKRWPMVMFYNMIDISTIAARCVWSLKFPEDELSGKDARQMFIKNIAEQLVEEQIRRRLMSETKLSRSLKDTANLALSKIEKIQCQRRGKGKGLVGKKNVPTKSSTIKKLSESKMSVTTGKRQKTEQAGITRTSEPGPSGKPTRYRCDLCGWKKQRKTQNRCVKCKRYICPEHCVPICSDCCTE